MLLPGDLDVCGGLFTEYRAEAARRGRSLPWGESIALGGFFAMALTMTDAQARPSPTGGPTTPGALRSGFPRGWSSWGTRTP